MVGITCVLSILASLVAASSAFSVGVQTALTKPYRAHLPTFRTVQRTAVFAALASTRKEGKGAKAAGGFAAGGFGKKPSGKAVPTVDAATLLRQSMDLYDRLCVSSGSVSTSDVEGDDAEMSELREYVVCVRYSGEAQLSDWVPVGCVALKWLGGSLANNPLLKGVADHRLAMPAAVRQLRREIWECAIQSAQSLQKLPRAAVEYAFEPLDDFSDVLDHAKSRGSSVTDAYAALGLERSPRDVKAAHRKLIMAHHPDALVGKPDDERAAAERRFQEVQVAYEVLGGGSGDAVGSWYENLGGKARADKFSGVLDLAGVGELPELWEAAVCPVDADLAKDFMARNVMRMER